MSIATVTPIKDDIQDLPYNLEAEQALLGALLFNNQNFDQVGDLLHAEHFANQIHGDIFLAIATLIDRGQIADPITLKHFFEKRKVLEPLGGAAYLADLVAAVLSTVNVRDYANVIYDLYLRRELINVGQTMIVSANRPSLELNAMTQLESAEKMLYDLASSKHGSKNFQTFDQALSQAITKAQIAYRHEGKVIGVTSGLQDIDHWLGGLHQSDLVIIAARPSMGKTILATNIAVNAAAAKSNGGPVAFFSLEMSAEQLACRILGTESRVSSDSIRKGNLSVSDFPKFVEVSRRMMNLPLFIDDTPAVTVSTLRNKARRLKRQHGLAMIVVDYLQLLESNNRKSENRVQELSDITRALKALAKEMDVPVIALSQLSRAVEQRDDKRPQLSDLRESGSIEQDADVVMFIYREEYYLSRKEPPHKTEKRIAWEQEMAQAHNVAEIIIAKQRHGPIGTVRLFFDGMLTRFGDLAQ